MSRSGPENRLIDIFGKIDDLSSDFQIIRNSLSENFELAKNVSSWETVFTKLIDGISGLIRIFAKIQEIIKKIIDMTSNPKQEITKESGDQEKKKKFSFLRKSKSNIDNEEEEILNTFSSNTDRLTLQSRIRILKNIEYSISICKEFSHQISEKKRNYKTMISYGIREKIVEKRIKKGISELVDYSIDFLPLLDEMWGYSQGSAQTIFIQFALDQNNVRNLQTYQTEDDMNTITSQFDYVLSEGEKLRREREETIRSVKNLGKIESSPQYTDSSSDEYIDDDMDPDL